MPKLSVVIITFNEERNIGDCIDSVKNIADDIIVVDSFSTDKTKEIATSKGARVIENSFKGHIQQKNWAIKQAQYPHILSLDADERPDERMIESIKEVKENWEYDGYYFNRLNNYCGKWLKHCGWYPDKKLRLWDSRKGTWGGKNPHDLFIMDNQAETGHLKGNILHYTYRQISEHIQQIDKFSTIDAQAAFENGKHVSLIKIWIYPKWKFFRDFIIKLGFLDGHYGYVVCKNSAHAKFLRYIKLRELIITHRKRQS